MTTNHRRPELITVVLSTYNAPAWLEKSLWGYACQTFRNFEIVIADDGSGPETADLIERMREQISVTPFLQREGINLRVTASFGVATYPHDAPSKLKLLAAADRSLFRSKASGRNRVTPAFALGGPWDAHAGLAGGRHSPAG